MVDQPFWDRFYQQPHPDLLDPSSFAVRCVSLLNPDDSVFELGCGNGRDALFLARSGFRVHASDPSSAAIAEVRSRMISEVFAHTPKLIARSMDELDDRHAGHIDAVYTRFVLHAVPPSVASSGMRWAARNLRPDGLMLIEVRSVLGSLYGKGEPAGRDAFVYGGHHRRFIRASELHDELVEVGFSIDDLVETSGVAVRGGDDPVVIRVVARRKRDL